MKGFSTLSEQVSPWLPETRFPDFVSRQLDGDFAPHTLNTIKDCSIGSHSHGHSVINFYYLAFTVNCEIYKESNDITGKDKNR